MVRARVDGDDALARRQRVQRNSGIAEASPSRQARKRTDVLLVLQKPLEICF